MATGDLRDAEAILRSLQPGVVADLPTVEEWNHDFDIRDIRYDVESIQGHTHELLWPSKPHDHSVIPEGMWRTAEGHFIPIEQLSIEHLLNILQWVYFHAQSEKYMKCA